MRRTIEITASFSGKIPTGSFENENPFFALKEIIEPSETEVLTMTDEEIKSRQRELHQLCYDQFKRQAEISTNERIAKTYKNIRWYDGKDGMKYPSVTSILDMDVDFKIPQDELKQYGARGTIIHKQSEIFLRTGEWKEAKDIPEIAADFLTLKRGSLGLEVEDVDFRAFFKDYPFKVLELEKHVVNHEHKYGGRLDILGVIESTNKGKWDKIEGVKFDVPTVLDIKTATSMDKTKGLTQLSAYAKVDGIEQICLIPLTKENQCGFAKPVITTNIERYFNLFLKARKDFENRYAI